MIIIVDGKRLRIRFSCVAATKPTVKLAKSAPRLEPAGEKWTVI